MITFYEIYEKFDKLNIFNSNWENEIANELNSINVSITNLMKQLKNIGDKITSSINDLSYITEKSTQQINSKLEEVDSTLKFGNLLNAIQTYQMYRVNKNTKPLT